MSEGKKPSVLLVDDDKFLLDMYALKFTQQGFAVQACLSVADGLSAMHDGFEADAIVFDITMPEMDGFAFLKKMEEKGIGKESIKIALSNQSDDAEKEKAAAAGADHYIVKANMLPSEVVNTVEKYIKNGK